MGEIMILQGQLEELGLELFMGIRECLIIIGSMWRDMGSWWGWLRAYRRLPKNSDRYKKKIIIQSRRLFGSDSILSSCLVC